MSTAVATYPMPSDVQVDAAGDHARYLLPRRRLGAVHAVGLFPIVFGLVMLGLLGNMALPLLKNLWSSDDGQPIFSYFFTGFLLLLVIPIVRLMVIGLVMMIGRTEMRLINGKLSAREHAGPVFWTRRFRKKNPLRRVSVGYGSGTAMINGKPTDKFKALASTAALGVEAGPDLKDRFLLTIGYPKQMLLPIGRDLADRLHVDFHEGLMSAGKWLEQEKTAESSA